MIDLTVFPKNVTKVLTFQEKTLFMTLLIIILLFCVIKIIAIYFYYYFRKKHHIHIYD